MKIYTIVFTAAFCLFAGLNTSSAKSPPITDQTVRTQIIEESIKSYGGACPCPYNSTRNGHSCGKRSAYSRPGGMAPLCYPKDISDEMVANYRKTHNLH